MILSNSCLALGAGKARAYGSRTRALVRVLLAAYLTILALLAESFCTVRMDPTPRDVVLASGWREG